MFTRSFLILLPLIQICFARVYWKCGNTKLEFSDSFDIKQRDWVDDLYTIHLSHGQSLGYQSIKETSLYISFRKLDAKDFGFFTKDFLELLHQVKLAELYALVVEFAENTHRQYSVIEPLRRTIYSLFDYREIADDRNMLKKAFANLKDVSPILIPPLFYLGNYMREVHSQTLAEILNINDPRFEQVDSVASFCDFIKSDCSGNDKLVLLLLDIDFLMANKCCDTFLKVIWVNDYVFENNVNSIDLTSDSSASRNSGSSGSRIPVSKSDVYSDSPCITS